jgi:antitoxin (DNA-binding transcriptional repressor) of toxin-antitoxin stability system
MTSVSIEDAAKMLPLLIEEARAGTIVIRDQTGDAAMLISLRPREVTEDKREAAIQEMHRLSEKISAELEESLAKEGLTVEEFLADVLTDV